MISAGLRSSSSLTPEKRIAVLHLIDSLAIGGAERVAVNLVNHLPRDRFEPHLCATRGGGPLEKEINDNVRVIILKKRSTIDLAALRSLYGYIRNNNIKIVHAHSSSLFTAFLVGLFLPSVRLVWHDHFGRYAFEKRNSLLYKILLSRASAIISVNQSLADWAVNDLSIASNKVQLIYNFSVISKGKGGSNNLPGSNGVRIACVANLRPEKDHGTLLVAMHTVVKDFPLAHLLIIGTTADQKYLDFLQEETRRYQIEKNVTFMGSCENVGDILAKCDIGVLSSKSEGLPLALIEYGLSGLSVVTTDIGQCKEVLDGGRCGMLVPAASPSQLASALSCLLKSAELRKSLGTALQSRVNTVFSLESSIEKTCSIYSRL